MHQLKMYFNSYKYYGILIIHGQDQSLQLASAVGYKLQWLIYTPIKMNKKSLVVVQFEKILISIEKMAIFMKYCIK